MAAHPFPLPEPSAPPLHELFGAELWSREPGERPAADDSAAHEVELLRFSAGVLMPENTGSALQFHARVLFTHREVRTRVCGHDAVVARVSPGLWDEKNAAQDAGASARLAALSARLAAAMSPTSTWRKGLQAVVALHLCPDVILLEVFFSAHDTVQFENNFAGLVPVVRANGGARALPAFNGMMWEHSPGAPCGVQPAHGAWLQHPEASAVRDMFETRDVMVYGDIALSAFNQERRRAPVGDSMITKQNIYTYHFMYGLHSSVCNTQTWMKQHKVPRLMACSVLLRAFSRIGAQHEVMPDSHFLKDLVLQAIAHAIQETYLGTSSYRRDVCGEDIRTRVFWRKMCKGSPLLPGGDCEDLAQTYAQLVYSVGADYAWYLNSMPQYRSFLMALFTPLGCVRLRRLRPLSRSHTHTHTHPRTQAHTSAHT